MLRTVSALALVPLLAGPVLAQSTLERVLAQLGTNGAVSGIAANVADNVADLRVDLTGGGGGEPLTLADADPDTRLYRIERGGWGEYWVTVGDLGTTLPHSQTGLRNPFEIGMDGSVLFMDGGSFTSYNVYSADGALIGSFDFGDTAEPLTGDEVVYMDGDDAYLVTPAGGDAMDWTAVMVEGSGGGSGSVIGDVLASAAIDGSISNIVTGLDQVQASVMGSVTAVDIPTVNFGNMATTVLGAVNTGEIGLGANQVVEEAIAGTTEAIRSEVQQIGTIPGLTQVALNSALNTMDIDGAITNRLTGVSGSVAAVSPEVMDIAMNAAGALSLSGVSDLLGSMETTVLGAVNTGTIVSGVNTQISGTVAGIVGNSGTNMFGG